MKIGNQIFKTIIGCWSLLYSVHGYSQTAAAWLAMPTGTLPSTVPPGIGITGTGGAAFKLLADNTSPIQFFTGGTTSATTVQRMTIDYNGNVGIGIASLGTMRLRVKGIGTAGSYAAAFENDYNNLSPNDQTTYTAYIDPSGILYYLYGSTYLQLGEFYVKSGGHGAFAGNVAIGSASVPVPTGYALGVNGSANITGIVSIGPLGANFTTPSMYSSTTNTGYSLYVLGGILTERTKVAVRSLGNWSDHGFAKDYKLTTIAEMETYIKANKHLPGVPSAEQMVENGLDVATMDAKLLEKIEELSLYVIQLKKEIDALKASK